MPSFAIDLPADLLEVDTMVQSLPGVSSMIVQYKKNQIIAIRVLNLMPDEETAEDQKQEDVADDES